MASFSKNNPLYAANSTSSPEARIAVIQLSLRAFYCGVLSLLPIIGLAPAVFALTSWTRVRVHYRTQWNPAADYLGWGTALAVLGLGITAIGIPAVILSVGICNAKQGM